MATTVKGPSLDATPCTPDDLFHRDFGVVRGSRILTKVEERSLYVTLQYCLFWLGNRVLSVDCLDASEGELLFWRWFMIFPQRCANEHWIASQLGLGFGGVSTVPRTTPPCTRIHRDGFFDTRVYTLRHFSPLRAAYLQLGVDEQQRIESIHILIGGNANTYRKHRSSYCGTHDIPTYENSLGWMGAKGDSVMAKPKINCAVEEVNGKVLCYIHGADGWKDFEPLVRILRVWSG